MSTSKLDLNFIREYIKNGEIEKEKLKNNLNIKVNSKEYYDILKYEKQHINYHSVRNLGLFRSVIFQCGDLVCFSPTKSLNESQFFETNSFKNVVLETYVEGTMINCFYNKKKREWMISTKTIMHADKAYCKDIQITFRKMFFDAFDEQKLSWNMFDRSYCYSFVLQHPDNKIVLPIEKPALYLVEVYKIDGFIVERINFKNMECFSNLLSCVNVTKEISIGDMSMDEIKLKYASSNACYDNVGIMFKQREGFERYKIRNPVYEYLHKLKGNNPKLQYQYYSLRKNNKVKEFLLHFPSYKERFSILRNELHKTTVQLWKNYISCFVRHVQPLEKYSYQFRPHMIALHEMYLNELREKKRHISRQLVINYISNLEVPRLMYLVNFPIKERNLKEKQMIFNKLQEEKNRILQNDESKKENDTETNKQTIGDKIKKYNNRKLPPPPINPPNNRPPPSKQ